jgi:kinesin family protein 2/24
MLMQIIDFGSTVRITSQNSANTDSSRSHAVLQINIR